MSKLIERFKYHQLGRESIDGIRYYTTPTGDKLASVTSILEQTRDKEKQQSLQRWKDAIGHAAANKIVEEACARGSRMHRYLEEYILNGKLSAVGSNPYAQISHKMAQLIVDRGLKKVSEYWGSEISLYYDPYYAGTTDAIGVWNDTPAILDFKQSNKVKTRDYIDDYFYQLVFYGAAHNHLFNTNINTGVIIMAVKPVLDSNFKIIKEPEYLEFVLSGSEWDMYTERMWNRLEKYYSNAIAK